MVTYKIHRPFPLSLTCFRFPLLVNPAQEYRDYQIYWTLATTFWSFHVLVTGLYLSNQEIGVKAQFESRPRI